MAAERQSKSRTAGLDITSAAEAIRDTTKAAGAPVASSAGVSAQAGSDVVVPAPTDPLAAEAVSTEQEPEPIQLPQARQDPLQQVPQQSQSLPFADGRVDEAAAVLESLQVTSAGEPSSEPDRPVGMDTNEPILQDYDEEANK